jgi:hypothetical protein
MIQVSKTNITQIVKSQPLKVSFAKIGMIIEDTPEVATTDRKGTTKLHYEAAPRITFAAKIVPMSEANPDMLEMHIGVSMSAGKDQFSKKIGRKIASERASKCPVLIVQCLESEVFPLFHKTVERLIPVILETKETMCDSEPLVHKMSLEGVLNEETAD